VSWIVVLSVFFLMLPKAGLAEQDYTRASNEARSVLQDMKGQWLSSKETYEQNLEKPLVTNMEMYSLDGRSHGNVQLMCPGTNPVIEALVQRGPTGDLSQVSVTYDGNLDGNPDGRYSVSGPISGVCANGVIKCRAGTWSDCEYYKWAVQGGRLTLQSGASAELGGCFCINSHCTSAPFSSFKDQVLRSIGGGIAGALIESNPNLGISSGKMEGYTIRYFAQNAKECSFGPEGQMLENYGLRSPESGLGANANLAILAQQEIEADKNDPDSPYYAVMHAGSSVQTERQTCTKQNLVSYDTSECEMLTQSVDDCWSLENDSRCQLESELMCDVNNNCIYTYKSFNPMGISLERTCKTVYVPYSCIVQPLGGSGFSTSVSPCGEGCYDFSIGIVGDNYWGGWCTIYSATQLFAVNEPDMITNVSLIRAKWDDYMQIFINDSLVWCGPDHCSNPGKLPDGAACERWTSWDWGLNENLTDYFRQKGTIVVKTVVEVAGRGEGYAYMRIRFKGKKKEICRDWWKTERTYVCRSDESNMPDLRRLEHIKSTMTETQGGVRFEDLVRNSSGEWNVILNQSVDVKTGNEFGNCIRACRLKKWIECAEATAATTTADYRHTPGHYKYVYRLCEDNSCPVGPGEEAVSSCVCINEFNQGVTLTEIMRLSSMDLICSSGQAHHY